MQLMSRQSLLCSGKDEGHEKSDDDDKNKREETQVSLLTLLLYCE